ncbi:MAG: hypothetical protein ABR587_09455 [Candidatus Binatia bacterium]
MEILNYTGKLERGESFLRAKAALADTDSLSIHIKFTRARGRDVNGYYRWEDRRMVLAVKQRLRYPRTAAYGVGTTPRSDRRLGGLPYRLVWHEERFGSPDDLFVFVAGHEFWHFLCHSGQRKRDHETKANCHGFAWLREFREWRGVEHPVAEIPLVPPRPDLVVAAEPPPAPALFPLGAVPHAVVTRAPRAVASSSRAVLDTARQLLLFR